MRRRNRGNGGAWGVRQSRCAHWIAPVAMVMAAGAAQAQFRASIQGSVTDPSGAAIPGATLTLTDVSTNKVLTATSNGDGVYNFNALPPARFKLSASAPGFQTKVIQDLSIIPEQPNSVNVQMDVTGATTTVNVSGDTASAVDTETANIGATITSNDIQHMPSFNRDVFTLTQLAPGAISTGAQSSGGGVYTQPGNQGPGGSGSSGAAPTENGPQANANGQQYQNNGIEVDGISTVSAVWGGTTIITPTEDSVDNVRVLTNEYDAEYGRFAGAQTLVTSKSGTNQLHGSAFIAVHRPGLNAYNRLPRAADGTPIGAAVRDQARFNQYGGSLGGPIWKDHVFAFFAYESSPQNTTSQSTGWYETSTFRSAAPKNSIASQFLNFAGAAPTGTIVTSGENCKLVGLQEGVNCNTIPGQGLDIGSPLTIGLGKQDPTATGTASQPGVGNGLDGVADVAFYLTQTPSSSYYRQYNGRLDGDVSKKDHLAFAIYWVPQGSTSYNGGARAYNLFNHEQINEAMSVIWNHTFSSNLVNEARLNAAGWRWNEIASNPQQPVGLPQDNITFFGPASGATLNQFGTSLGSDLNQWTYGAADVATLVSGKHTIKFGGDGTQLRYLNNPIGRPNYSFYNIWDFLNDAPWQESGGFNSVTGLPGGTRSDERQYLWGLFAQDGWKVLPNLTVNLGVRYSYFGQLYANQNNLPSVRLGSGSSAYTGIVVQQGGNAWTPQKGNFGPQFGFNWSPGTFKSRLVVRGGYGLNFNQEEIAITANQGNNPPTQDYYTFQWDSPTSQGANGADILYGISTTGLQGFASNPHTITSYNSANLPTGGNANLTIIGDGHGKLPTTYVEHYSLETTFSGYRQLVATLGYQGSVGRHLINHETPNAPAIVAGYGLNPLVTGGDLWTNEGSSNNNQFLAELQHPMSHHLMLDGQFFWAKSMDTDGSGPYSEDPYFPENSLYSYGPSDFNVGKSFKLFGLWQPVLFHGGHGWAEKILGDWSLSGIFQVHTGFPYSPTYGIGQSLYCSNCGYYGLRPYYLGGGNGDHSNKAFIQNTNFPGYAAAQAAAVKPTATVNGSAKTIVSYSNAFFTVPNFQAAMQAATGSGFPSPNLALPGRPGLDRNSFTGPHYRDVDATLTKGFGIPNTRLLGESARLEIRADAFNLFNILNLNPSNVTSNIDSGSFGQDIGVLGGRTVQMQARFSF